MIRDDELRRRLQVANDLRIRYTDRHGKEQVTSVVNLAKRWFRNTRFVWYDYLKGAPKIGQASKRKLSEKLSELGF